MRKVSILAMLAFLFLAGCATKGPSAYDQLYSQASNEVNIAKQMGFLWRDTEKYLRESRLAQEQGDKRKAKELAQRALNEAKMAQQQAREQANPPVVYPDI